jgi:two-component system, chemotaxis family, response regulator Rcp1
MFGDIKTKPMEILLVEDGLVDAKVTIMALRRSAIHHRLTLVRTASEAIQFIRREGVFSRAPRPDLVLLDMMLPDGSGIDVLEALNEKQQYAIKSTVVVLTASEDEATHRRCTELGVHDYIQKPVHESEFMRVVRDHKRLMIHMTPILQPA